MPMLTLHLITSAGTPADLTIDAQIDGKALAAFFEKVDDIDDWLLRQGWFPNIAAVDAAPADTAPQHDGPTLHGYPCSPVVDAEGKPDWLKDEQGRIYKIVRRDGDTWWTHRTEETNDDGKPVFLHHPIKIKLGNTLKEE